LTDAGNGQRRIPVDLARLAQRRQSRSSYIAPPRTTLGIALALSSGVYDYVQKPFEREAIRAKLAAAGLV